MVEEPWRGQIAYSFDRESLRLIWKGMVHAAIVSVLLAVLDAAFQVISGIQLANPLAASALAMLSQTAYQTARQWIAGR